MAWRLHQNTPMRALVLSLIALGLGCGDATSSSDASTTLDAATVDASGSAVDAAVGSCPTLDLAGCLSRDDCHAAFEITECDNILGYCAAFISCDDGPAQCAGTPTCERAEPSCPGPYVVSYTETCYGPCVRADQCEGCRDTELTFTQAQGCANDGSVEFCIPTTLERAIELLAPTVTCAAGGGRAGCDPKTQLLCLFPTDASTCTSGGALTDDAWATLCGLTMLPDVTEIVPTFFE